MTKSQLEFFKMLDQKIAEVSLISCLLYIDLLTKCTAISHVINCLFSSDVLCLKVAQ